MEKAEVDAEEEKIEANYWHSRIDPMKRS